MTEQLYHYGDRYNIPTPVWRVLLGIAERLPVNQPHETNSVIRVDFGYQETGEGI